MTNTGSDKPLKWPEEEARQKPIYVPPVSKAYQNAPTIGIKYPDQVEVVRISLSWSDAFEIGFKLMVVFSIFQAIFFVIAYLAWG